MRVQVQVQGCMSASALALAWPRLGPRSIWHRTRRIEHTVDADADATPCKPQPCPTPGTSAMAPLVHCPDDSRATHLLAIDGLLHYSYIHT